MCWEVYWCDWGVAWGWEPTREAAEAARDRAIEKMGDAAGPVFSTKIWDWFQ